MKLFVTNVDAITKEEFTRQMTDEEFEMYSSEQKTRENEELKKTQARLALLDRLGISEDEAKILFT